MEPLGDWVAVASRGGPIRGLDRHMPAFGDALSPDQIEKAVKYLWSFCTDPAWPRGDLNFPRAFFTEKAFPENETVWTTGMTAVRRQGGHQRAGLRASHRRARTIRGEDPGRLPAGRRLDGRGARGLGDVELALRRTFYASYDRGSIFAAGAAATLPTGKEDRGLGNGFAIFEPFAMYGQMLGTNGFLQLHAGYEIPSDHSKGQNEAFLRTALGYSLAQDQGFGRVWSPMAEVIVAKPREWRGRMGRRAADAGLAQQAPARSVERRRARAGQRARGSQAAVAHLLPVGLVRRRTVPILEVGEDAMTITHPPTSAAGLRNLAVCVPAGRTPRRAGDDQDVSKTAHEDARDAPGSLALHPLRELRRLPQQPRRSLRRGRLDRRDLASTMMANSARDPYWQASVRRETIDHPKHSAAIQDECAAVPHADGHADRARGGRQG